MVRSPNYKYFVSYGIPPDMEEVEPVEHLPSDHHLFPGGLHYINSNGMHATAKKERWERRRSEAVRGVE